MAEHLSSQPMQTSSVRTGTLKTTFVLESPHDQISSGNWAARELSTWLRPEHTHLRFIRAISDIEDSGWFNKQPAQYVEAISEQREAVLDANKAVLNGLEAEGFRLMPHYTESLSDRLAKRVLTELTDTDEDLLVLSSTESPQPQHGTSSFLYRLASHAPCSALLLKRPINRLANQANTPLHVIFATDGTEASATAARKLPNLLKTDAMEVTIVTVQNPDVLENAIFAPYVNTSAVDEALRENATMILNITRDLLESGGVKVRETRRILGAPAWELTHLLEVSNPDLLVVGSHNRTGLPAWLLGSVSGKLAQQDTHSILVAR